MERLRKAERLLVRAENAALVGLLSVMVLLSFLQVVLRQFFGIGILWGDTFLRHLVLWVGFLGAALAAADSKHFAWEAFANRPGRLGLSLRLLANASAVVICALLAAASWEFLLEEKSSAAVLFTAGPVAVPAWTMAAIVPAGFALVGLHAAARAVLAAGALAGVAEPEADAADPL